MSGVGVSAGTVGLVALVGALRAFPGEADDARRVERIRVLEELKSAVAAAQAVETAAFVASQRERQAAAGVPVERVGRGIASQIGLAKRMSPFHAQRYAGWATILTRELPATLAVLQAGRTSEWRAMLVARETAWLSREHRAGVDRELAPQLERLGDRKVEAEAKKLAYRLDPHGYVDRIRAAAEDRRVTLRPAPDVMCRLTGLLPVAQGVAAHAALGRDADALIASGDSRSRGQVMADLVVERVTGQASAAGVPVEVNLVVTDQSLFAGGGEPAHLDGYGPIPAATAREMVLGAGEQTPVWLRRLFTRPGTGALAAMQSRRRAFTPAQRHFLRLRDRSCRTPWCDAPIRHADHVVAADHGGPTSVSNGQGLCAACNFAKQAPGWRSYPTTHNEIVIITPTGHRYHSRAPDPPGRQRIKSPIELRFAELIRRAVAPASGVKPRPFAFPLGTLKGAGNH